MGEAKIFKEYLKVFSKATVKDAFVFQKELKKKLSISRNSKKKKVDNVDEKTLCDVLKDHKDIKLSEEQRRSYFKVRNNINCILKNRSNNVKVVIYIDNDYVLIIAGYAENHINFYINSDATFEKEWLKRKEDDDLKYEIDTEKLDARIVHDEIQKFKHKFEGVEKQKQALYTVRDKIDELVGFWSNNIRLTLIFDDVLPEPIVFKAGKGENQLCIYINSDGTQSCVWERKTWLKSIADFGKQVIGSEIFRNFLKVLFPLTSCLAGLLV